MNRKTPIRTNRYIPTATTLPAEAFKPSMVQYVGWQMVLLHGAIGIIHEALKINGHIATYRVLDEMVRRLSKIGDIKPYRLKVLVSTAARASAFSDYNITYDRRGFTLRLKDVSAPATGAATG